MSDVIGRGVIEVSADSSGLNAAIDKARKSIAGLGEASKSSSEKSSRSIDNHIKRLQQEHAQLGMNAREAQAYRLALRGASDEQLRAADNTLKMIEAYKEGEKIGERITSGLRTFGTVAATSLIAATVAIDSLLKKAGDFQDMAEKTGDTAENIASLAVAAGTAGVQMDSIVSASTKLTKGLTGVDDETKDAGAAIKALGLNLEEFKNQKPADQLEAVAKALDGFEDGASKTAVAMALFGKSGAELLPFLKTLGEEGGRQVILTEKQIQLADEYADKQGKLAAEISLHAQAIATEAAPALTDFMEAIADMAKDQEIAAAATEVLKGAIQGGIVIFQTIAVVAANVGFVFAGVYREVIALKNQLVALATLDFDKFTAISDAVKADGERALATLTKFEQKVMSIGQAQDPANYSNELRGKPTAEEKPKKKLNYSGASAKDGKGKADQEAKAQLAYDLEQIKKTSEAEINAYSNAEKILEAMRAASLVDDRKYYQEKLGFIQLNSQAQEAATIKEIERLQAEKLAGKDAIDNQRKIVDAEAKLAKIRADSATSQQVLKIQEEAYFERIRKGYIEAEAAARNYLNTINQQYARELDGMGKGNQNRRRNAGRAQIEDRYSEQFQKLESDRRKGVFDGREDDYAQELDRIKRFQAEALASYNTYFDSILEKQQSFAVGASEALQNYYDESQNIAAHTEEVFRNAFTGLEDALVQFTQTGKLDFKSLISSINADIARIAIKESITGPLAGFLKDAIGGKKPTIDQGGGFIEQTAAANASTIALNALAAAANSSAAAIAGNRPQDITPGSKQVIPSMGDFTRADRVMGDAEQLKEVAAAQQTGADSAVEFGKTATAAAQDITKLAQAAGAGGSALGLLPSIISLISTTMSAGGGGSSGGGTGGLIGSLISAGMSYFGAPSLGVETVASGAVSADFKEMPNFLRGGRAIGGPVSAGGLYEVNEKGRPELLQVAGKEYLMMGSQGGKVEANPQMGGGGAVYNLAVNVTPPPGSNAATANQWGAMAGRQMQTALRRNG